MVKGLNNASRKGNTVNTHPIFNTLDEARRYALNFSRKNTTLYVTLHACFGLMVSTSKTLNVFAPSDSYTKTYWLNGKEKSFTNAQVSANDLATPCMS